MDRQRKGMANDVHLCSCVYVVLMTVFGIGLLCIICWIRYVYHMHVMWTASLS